MNSSEKLRILAKNASQTALADALAVTQPTISRVLRGLQVPSEPLVRAIDSLFLQAQSCPSCESGELDQDRAA